MPFLSLIFVIILIWIAPKIIRAFLLVRRIRKQTRDMFSRMYDAQEPPRRKPGWSTPQPRRKKIDPNVGEYVKFQEIETTETVETETKTTPDGATRQRTTYTVEQQITDAEWEDL